MVSIEAIYYSPRASQSMISLDKATLIQGLGLEGDRYAQHAGTYSVLRGSLHHPGEQEPGRQLTLISGEGAIAAFKKHGIEWNNNKKTIGDLRRNVCLNGISSEELLKWIGSIVQLGNSGAKLLVHRNCVPCMYNERKNETPGLMEALWDAGGVSCEVLQGGNIAVGDPVTVHPNTEGHVIDVGHRANGFFVRPSRRTGEMIRDALKEKKELHEALLTIDPEGVDRLQSSYESVGLSFWPTQRNS